MKLAAALAEWQRLCCRRCAASALAQIVVSREGQTGCGSVSLGQIRWPPSHCKACKVHSCTSEVLFLVNEPRFVKNRMEDVMLKDAWPRAVDP